jgi:hypothetical protein
VERLLTQVARILALNGLGTVTREVVEAAREVLVIRHGMSRVGDRSIAGGVGVAPLPRPIFALDNAWLSSAKARKPRRLNGLRRL